MTSAKVFVFKEMEHIVNRVDVFPFFTVCVCPSVVSIRPLPLPSLGSKGKATSKA